MDQQEEEFQSFYEGELNGAFAVTEQEMVFETTQDNQKIQFKQIGLTDEQGEVLLLNQYSISFNFVLENENSELTNGVSLIQIGTNTMNRIVFIGISKDRRCFISIFNVKGKLQTCYSQCKIKQDRQYNFCFVTTLNKNTTTLTLYLDGQVESQMSTTVELEHPQSIFYIGSESTSKLFKGTLNYVTIYSFPLTQAQITDIASHQDVSPITVLQSKNEQQAQTAVLSKQLGIPQNLILANQSQTQFKQSQDGQSTLIQADRATSYSEHRAKSQEKLYNYLNDKRDLSSRLREVVQNFEWIFNLLQSLSPNIDDGGNGTIKFDSFNLDMQNEIANPEQDQYGLSILPFNLQLQWAPFYLIEFKLFFKVICQLSISFSKDEILQVAKHSNSLLQSKKFAKYDKVIQYDLFLLSCRDCLLTPKQILEMRMDYRENPLQPQQEVDDDEIQDEEYQVQKKTLGELGLKGQENYEDLKFEDFCIQNLIYQIKYQTIQQQPHKLIVFYQDIYWTKECTEAQYKQSKCIDFNQSNEKNVEIEEQIINIDTGVYKIKQLQLNYVELEPEVLLPSQLDITLYNVKTEQEDKKKIVLLQTDLDIQKGIGIKCESNQQIQALAGTYTKQINGIVYPAGFKFWIVDDQIAKQVYNQPKVVVQKDNLEMKELMPELSPKWNSGKFQIVINYCHNLARYNMTTWHSDNDFIELFNTMGDALTQLFPEIEIIGNYDAPPSKQMEYFQIYIRGVGPINQRDLLGRHMLFVNNKSLKLLRDSINHEIINVYSRIVLLQAVYGGTHQMAQAQQEFLNQYQSQIPAKYEHSTDFPAQPKQISQQLDVKVEIEIGSKMKCRNWGCFIEYKYETIDPDIKPCLYHPGSYQNGSKYGLWPESWTCCRGAWDAPGCLKGQHKGTEIKKFKYLCINHGEINPRTQKPDFFCGKTFQNENGCEIHSGYIKKNGNYSCCDGTDFCLKQNHSAAEWPEESAKKYFVEKKVLYGPKYEQYQLPFTQTFAQANVFRETKEYKEVQNRGKLLQQKILASEKNDRKCLNWGCTKIFQDINNKNHRGCKTHVGVYDFGYTGTKKISELIGEFNDDNKALWWRPHWTCCRREWSAPGCTMSYHDGPLIDELKPQKYQPWPSIQAQKYFQKRVSKFWQGKLQSCDYDAEQLSIIFDANLKELGNGSYISIDRLPELCDKLKLHVKVLSEDLSYHFKFLSVVQKHKIEFIDDQNNFVDLEVQQGIIDKQRFINWWLADLDHIRIQ